jgi:hypothetical protein
MNVYDKLVPELRDDPAGIGYAAMSDQEALDALKAATVERIRSSMSGNELFINTVGSEFAALVAEKRQLWVAFTSAGNVDPSHPANTAFVQWVFGAASATVAALAEARMETIPRITFLGLGVVEVGNIKSAREIMAGGN